MHSRTIEKKKDFDKYKGKLAGMIVIFGADPEVKPITEAPYKRLSDDDLAKLADYQIRRPPALPLRPISSSGSNSSKT